MNIRIAEERDVNQIKIILDRNFDEIMSKHHSAAILDKFKGHNTCESLAGQLKWKKVYVAEEGGAILATGAFANFGSQENPRYAISNLYVMPERQNQGIGQKIFEKLWQCAQSHRADRFHVPSSRNAIGFYEKMGFAIDKEQPDVDDEITWMTRRMNMVDAEEFPIQEGSVIRVDPDGQRVLRAGEEELIYLCIQAQKGSLKQATQDDGVMHDTKASWM